MVFGYSFHSHHSHHSCYLECPHHPSPGFPPGHHRSLTPSFPELRLQDPYQPFHPAQRGRITRPHLGDAAQCASAGIQPQEFHKTMSFATIVMAGAALAGLFCLLVLGLVGTTLLVLPLLSLKRSRQSRRQPARAARPTRPEVQAAPTTRTSPAAAVDRPAFVNLDGVIGLYTAGLLH